MVYFTERNRFKIQVGSDKNMKKDFMEQCPPSILEYLTYMQNIKGKSEHTVDEYFLDLRTFFRYMKIQKGKVSADTPVEDVSILDIDNDFLRSITFMDISIYMNYCISERKNQAVSRSRKTSSLKGFFSYITKRSNIIENNPAELLELPKKPKKLPKYLTLEQSIALLNAADGDFKERDYCMLTLFLNCGMRLSELVGINLQDISTNKTLRLTGKGNKQRIIYLNDACIEAIENYKKVRPNDGVSLEDKNALFLSKRKKRISPKTVQYIVNKYLEKIGLDAQGYSVHKLRHTAATLMYQHGHVDMRVLKDILGHESLGTTQIYTHISDTQMQKAADANPLSSVHPQKSKEKKNEE